MRPIEGGKLTPELEKKLKGKTISESQALLVQSYRKLVEHTAQLSYLNKDHLLFYRGQHEDYLNKVGKSTIYPTIYRGDYVRHEEINYRFDLLYGASKILIEEFKYDNIDGTPELSRKRYIQWSILQHYGVCRTPLLDLTQSLRVACSFGQLSNQNKYAYVFVFGLPYITNRISIHSEHDIVNIRLLSICPPKALRPYFQEGFLAGTEDITNEFDNKSELDFNNRLIAKFKIPNNENFWKSSFSAIPRDALYPEGDKVKDICDKIKDKVRAELQSGQLGDFLKSWSNLVDIIYKLVNVPPMKITMRDAIKKLYAYNKVDELLISRLDSLRRFRNELVHNPKKVTQETLLDYAQNLNEIENILRNIPRKR
jgi:hypothetical protein